MRTTHVRRWWSVRAARPNFQEYHTARSLQDGAALGHARNDNSVEADQADAWMGHQPRQATVVAIMR
ncbi:MAG: hypothetical protein PVI25_10550 [Gammaproteobacteria bacterium]